MCTCTFQNSGNFNEHMHREHAAPHGERMLLPEEFRLVVKKKKKERKHCEETTKPNSNEGVFEIYSAEHLADNVTSKPVYGFQYF